MDADTIRLIEALIFAAPEPVDEDQIARLADFASAGEIPAAVAELNRVYEESDRAFRIIRGGGGYRFSTLPDYGPWVKRLVFGSGRAKLSRAALETISLIAYRQPISRSQIEDVRGVDAGGVLRMLLERKLIGIQGRGAGPGRPLLYATTSAFLRHFGLDSLDHLPRPEEFSDDLPAGVPTGQPTGELFRPGSNVDTDS